jgi:hypothetical protein
MAGGRCLSDIRKWLDLPDVIEHLGAGRVAMHRKEVLRELRLTHAQACSSSRIDGWLDSREHYYAPGMVLSRIGTRQDSPEGGGAITPRWTPAMAVAVEDRLDEMDAVEAVFYEHPPSLTGIQFQRIRALQGHKVKKPHKEQAVDPVRSPTAQGGHRLSFVAGVHEKRDLHGKKF